MGKNSTKTVQPSECSCACGGHIPGAWRVQKRGAGLLTRGSPTSVSGSHSASTLVFLAHVGLWAQPGPAGELTAASWSQLGVSALS